MVYWAKPTFAVNLSTNSVLLHQIYNLYGLDLGNRAFDRIFDAGFERHVRHGAVTTVTDKLKSQNVVFCDLEDLHIAAIGFEIRSDAVERLFDPLCKCGGVHIMHSSRLFLDGTKLAFRMAI